MFLYNDKLQTNIRWRKIKDVAFALGDVLQQWRLAPNIRDTIRSGIANVLYEVRRWGKVFGTYLCTTILISR